MVNLFAMLHHFRTYFMSFLTKPYKMTVPRIASVVTYVNASTSSRLATPLLSSLSGKGALERVSATYRNLPGTFWI